MRRSLFIIALILTGFVFVNMSSCRHRPDPEPDPDPQPNWYSPAPGPGGTLPEKVLPDTLRDGVLEHFTTFEGENPPSVNGQFVSHPHVLLYSTNPDDTPGTLYNDRYVAYFRNGSFIDYYGKQWDNQYDDWYEEVYRKLYVIGEGDGFSCYYLTEGYPNGLYAKQSTVFSGKWNANYGGLVDFQVAVILLETSNNPNLATPGTFRVLGDGDGLAQDTTWIAKSLFDNNITVTDEDAFSMFRIK